MKRFVLCSALMALLVTIAACEKEKEPEEPPPPPPPTAQELMSPLLTQLNETGNAIARGGPISKSARDKLLNAARTAKGSYIGQVNGEEALSRTKDEIDRRIYKCDELGLWHGVRLLVDVYKVFDPDARRYERLVRRAVDELNKPDVKITGFYMDPEVDKTFVFMQAYIPATGEILKVDPVREGEEFLPQPYTLKLHRIVGNNSGIELEYVKTGERFEIAKDRKEPFGPPPEPPEQQQQQQQGRQPGRPQMPQMPMPGMPQPPGAGG
jgi:hypothetical protein